MKLNKKGVTIVEVIVSMTMLVIIVTFLFQIILSLKEVYDTSGIKTEMLNKQAIISRMINNDLKNKKLQVASKCDFEDKCLSFYFEDGTEKTLEFKYDSQTNKPYILYGDYKTELVTDSFFSNFQITSNVYLSTQGLTNDSILNIYIPIKHPLLTNQDYGINILYQYNSKTTSIADLAINGNTGASRIYLSGASNMTWYNTVDFVDPGYFYLDENRNLKKDNKTNDYVIVTKGEIINNTQIITYTSIADSSISVQRIVNYIDTNYVYPYNGAYYVFSAPISGTYNINLWGANGASTTLNETNYSGGTGAYVSGNIDLVANEKIYIYVGGAPSGDIGGYNGGGSITTNQSSFGGTAGGGATDIRLIAGNWDSSDGLISRIMVAAGGGGASSSNCGYETKTGGLGGTLTSEPSLSNNLSKTVCDDGIWTLASGATQTSGGQLAVYNPSNALIGTYTAGHFGYASSPSEYSGDIKAGGGGGYFGGASSGYGSFATGGSSFVSGCTDCIAVLANGQTSETNIHYSGKQFSNYVIANSTSENYVTNPSLNNNGYASIKLVGISYGTNR